MIGHTFIKIKMDKWVHSQICTNMTLGMVGPILGQSPGRINCLSGMCILNYGLSVILLGVYVNVAKLSFCLPEGLSKVHRSFRMYLQN